MNQPKLKLLPRQKYADVATVGKPGSRKTLKTVFFQRAIGSIGTTGPRWTLISASGVWFRYFPLTVLLGLMAYLFWTVAVRYAVPWWSVVADKMTLAFASAFYMEHLLTTGEHVPTIFSNHPGFLNYIVYWCTYTLTALGYPSNTEWGDARILYTLEHGGDTFLFINRLAITLTNMLCCAWFVVRSRRPVVATLGCFIFFFSNYHAVWVTMYFYPYTDSFVFPYSLLMLAVISKIFSDNTILTMHDTKTFSADRLWIIFGILTACGFMIKIYYVLLSIVASIVFMFTMWRCGVRLSRLLRVYVLAALSCIFTLVALSLAILGQDNIHMYFKGFFELTLGDYGRKGARSWGTLYNTLGTFCQQGVLLQVLLGFFLSSLAVYCLYRDKSRSSADISLGVFFMLTLCFGSIIAVRGGSVDYIFPTTAALPFIAVYFFRVVSSVRLRALASVAMVGVVVFSVPNLHAS